MERDRDRWIERERQGQKERETGLEGDKEGWEDRRARARARERSRARSGKAITKGKLIAITYAHMIMIARASPSKSRSTEIGIRTAALDVLLTSANVHACAISDIVWPSDYHVSAPCTSEMQHGSLAVLHLTDHTKTALVGRTRGSETLPPDIDLSYTCVPYFIVRLF